MGMYMNPLPNPKIIVSSPISNLGWLIHPTSQSLHQTQGNPWGHIKGNIGKHKIGKQRGSRQYITTLSFMQVNCASRQAWTQKCIGLKINSTNSKVGVKRETLNKYPIGDSRSSFHSFKKKRKYRNSEKTGSTQNKCRTNRHVTTKTEEQTVTPLVPWTCSRTYNKANMELERHWSCRRERQIYFGF